MPGRKYPVAGGLYRYGFNGKENDNEVKGEGNQQDYGMRIYDPRLGRFLSVDPITKEYPHYTPYSYAGNKPIKFIDLDGAEESKNWMDYNFTDLMNWVSKPTNPVRDDGFVHSFGSSFNRNFNPFYYCFVIVTDNDIASKDHGEMNRLEALQGLTTMVVLHKSVGVAAKPSPTVALEKTLAENNAAMGSSSAAKTVVENESTSSASGATTKSLQVGQYSKMAKANAKTGLSSDHIPSFAAVKKHVETSLGRKLTASEASGLKKSTLTLVYETKIHETASRTFAGRNNPIQIAKDASNLLGAIQQDIKSLTPSLLKSGYSQSDIDAAQQSLMQKFLPKK